MITEVKKIKIRGKEYVLNFPNVGQYYEIEATKQRLGRGFYNTMLGNPTKTAQAALDMIDIEATISVLMPDLMKDLAVDSFSKLGLKDYQEIKKIYNSEIFPFMKEISDMLSSF